MAGHNKWSKIKRKKGVADAAKGKLFTKLIREIMVAARSGGANPDYNPRLRLAVQEAKESSMPRENIDRAIKKATGNDEDAQFEEILYEGFGPAGTAFLVQVTTDNRNRTAPELRTIFSKTGGRMGESGSVAWMFRRRGILELPKTDSEERMMELAVETGSEDLESSAENYILYCAPENFESVRQKLEALSLRIEHASIGMTPQTTLILSGEDALSALRLYHALEDHDDVASVYVNFDVISEVKVE